MTSLNLRQQEAVIAENKRLLVLAGAGSGKTKTLLEKINYLLEAKGVSSSEVLAITFTKNAAEEMLDRMLVKADTSGHYEQVLKSNAKKDVKGAVRKQKREEFRWVKNLSFRTFHSFCYSLVKLDGVKEFDNQFRIVLDQKNEKDEKLDTGVDGRVAPETSDEIFHKLLIECCDDRQYLLDLKRYILDYFVDRPLVKNVPVHDYHRDAKIYTSLNGTKVRSKSEQFIADWLYRHSIPFEYEPRITIRDFAFRPDFFIPTANLCIEHVSDKSYALKDKEEQYRSGNLLCVRTFEAMANDSALFSRALSDIVRGRLGSAISSETSLQYREEFESLLDYVRDFRSSVKRVMDMIKVDHTDISQLENKAGEDQHERIRSFYALAIPLIRRYIAYCTDKSYLDFNDLVTKAIALLSNNPDIREKWAKQYRHILVDEFQDVNKLQVELLKLLLSDESQLFCVGDDWQSIYGFRGSDVRYIVEFEKQFPGARVIKLDLNYRSVDSIVSASNEVIRNNKVRIDKEVRSVLQGNQKIHIYAGLDEERNVQWCVNKVKELIMEGVPSEEIMFLYRRSKMYRPYSDAFWKERIRVTGRTIHGAKGLEARVVFIIGLTEGSGGFPDTWLHDRIFQVIRPTNHDELLEEERRLYYVALTRAREQLYLITEKGNESSFIREVPVKYVERGVPVMDSIVRDKSVCPGCGVSLDANANANFCSVCGEKLK
jgi:DNA helicase-4